MRLRVRDRLYAIDAPRSQIGDHFPGAIGIHVVEDGEGAPRRGNLAQDNLLRRFVEGDDAEAGRVRHARANDLRRIADLGSAERRQRMQDRVRFGAAGSQNGDENDRGGAHWLSG